MKTIYVVIAAQRRDPDADAMVRAFSCFENAQNFIWRLERAKKGDCDIPPGVEEHGFRLELFDYFYVSTLDFDDDAEAD